MHTNGASYQPVPTSVPGRVIAFFRDNPDEELNVDDLAEKFDLGGRNVHALLASAVQSGALRREQDASGDYIFKAGAATSTGVSKPAKAPAPPKPRRAPVADLDLSAIPLATNVPLPGGTPRKKLDYRALLNRMQPGQSAELPAQCRGALAATMADIHRDEKDARKFTLRVDRATEKVRVWRLTDAPEKALAASVGAGS